jgi:hypothetical protein
MNRVFTPSSEDFARTGSAYAETTELPGGAGDGQIGQCSDWSRACP